MEVMQATNSTIYAPMPLVVRDKKPAGHIVFVSGDEKSAKKARLALEAKSKAIKTESRVFDIPEDKASFIFYLRRERVAEIMKQHGTVDFISSQVLTNRKLHCVSRR
jgi:hypothetical protein